MILRFAGQCALVFLILVAATGRTACGQENISDWLEPFRAKSELPALGAAVVKDGKLHALGASGVRKIGDETKVTVEDQFHLGSCTKAMTATLVALLVQDEKLEWDLTLDKAFPDLAETMKPQYRTVTLDHLLMHRSGVPVLSPGGQSGWEWGRELTGTPTEQRYETVKWLLNKEPESTPGEKFRYANEGYMILGAIVERTAGKSWETLMQERIFTPLGMTSAGFGPMGSTGKIDQPWQHAKRGVKTTPIEPFPRNDNPPIYAPGGTVHASLRDWARFVSLHFDGTVDGKRILTEDSLKHLHTPKFEGTYAGGWGCAERPWGGHVLTHSGSNNQNYCVVWLAPEKQFAVLVATNQGSGTDFENRACDEVCAKAIERFLAGRSDAR
jgi:CubicO group peptidase (beta-lactamase class C family)